VTGARGDATTRVLVVDDEEPARSLLAEVLSAEAGIEVAGVAANGFEAVRLAAELEPDAVFLDIEMPKLNGFEVAELLPPEIAAVFVTAYARYAIQAFDIHAADYVLKPYRPERLREALRRARERISAGRRLDAAAVAAGARPPGAFADRIVVREGTRVHVLPVAQVDALEAQDDYVVVRSAGRRHRKHQTLAGLAESLDPARFLRVHRSFVINVERLARIEPYAKGSVVAILADGSKIPVSREGHAKLKELLGG